MTSTTFDQPEPDDQDRYIVRALFRSADDDPEPEDQPGTEANPKQGNVAPREGTIPDRPKPNDAEQLRRSLFDDPNSY